MLIDHCLVTHSTLRIANNEVVESRTLHYIFYKFRSWLGEYSTVANIIFVDVIQKGRSL